MGNGYVEMTPDRIEVKRVKNGFAVYVGVVHRADLDIWIATDLEHLSKVLQQIFKPKQREECHD